jgi:hypothetical protein
VEELADEVAAEEEDEDGGADDDSDGAGVVDVVEDDETEAERTAISTSIPTIFEFNRRVHV